jgi:hypothetical protein
MSDCTPPPPSPNNDICKLAERKQKDELQKVNLNKGGEYFTPLEPACNIKNTGAKDQNSYHKRTQLDGSPRAHEDHTALNATPLE